MQWSKKRFLTIVLLVALILAIAKFLSPDAWQRALAAVGVAKFVRETAPRYLRERLAVPENPVAKRERLLRELSQQIGEIERELEAVAPATGGGGSTAGGLGTGRAPLAPTGTSPPSTPSSPPGTPAPPTDQATSPPPTGTSQPFGGPALRERIERTQELLARSEGVIEELGKANPGQGLLAKAAERVLDRILPQQKGTNEAVCPQQ